MDKRPSKQGYMVASWAVENQVGTQTTLLYRKIVPHRLLAPRARARGHGDSAPMSKQLQQYCDCISASLKSKPDQETNKPNLNNQKSAL